MITKRYVSEDAGSRAGGHGLLPGEKEKGELMWKAIIVEDEMFVRMGIRISVDWEKLGIEVIGELENGQQAWEAYEELHPDLILTDLKMPMMTGMELIRRIREKDERTRIIILSCLEEFDLVREAISLGVTDYILKLTMTREDMVKVVQKAVTELKAMDASAHASAQNPQEQVENILLDIFHYNDSVQRGKLEHMELPFSFRNMMLAALEIRGMDAIRDQLHDKYGGVVSFTIRNMLEELVGRYMRGAVIQETEKRFFILASQEEAEVLSTAEYRFDEMLQNVIHTMSVYFSIRVCPVTSRLYSGIEHLSGMYHECEYGLEMRKFYPEGSILHYGEILRENVQERAHSALVDFAENLEDHPVSRQYLERKIPELLAGSSYEQYTACFLNMARSELGDQVLSEEQKQKRLDRFAKSCETVGTLEELFAQYRKFLETLSTRREEGTYVSRPVARAVEFIHQNYRKDISLEAIAGYAEMSPNYVCSLFKKEIGMNLTRYLMEYRIGKAKQLLISTNMRSYEIAAATGFRNDSYFSRSFKKYTGYSPSEYAKDICDVNHGNTPNAEDAGGPGGETV